MWNDIRYGVRKLRKSPGFTAVAVITLALGIGATTAIFSVTDALLWKPVPLPHLDRMAMVLGRVADDPNQWNSVAPADLDDFRRSASSFDGLGYWSSGSANIVGANGEAERVSQYLVSSNFFKIAGVSPALGRTFDAQEEQPGRDRVVILSDPLWRRRFGGDPGIIGKTIRLDDENYVVAGVMPPKFDFPKTAELWTPLALTPAQRTSRTQNMLVAVGLLKPGVSASRAAAEVDAIGARLAREYPDSNQRRSFQVMTTHDFLIGSFTHQYVLMLFWAVLFVLAIACANVANLQLARATSRTRETAVRTALGASRGRVVAQLVTESLLLGLAGAGLGLFVAKWGIDMIRGNMPADVVKFVVGWTDISLDGRALAFTLLAAVITGVLAGISPALQVSHPRLGETLKEGGRGSSAGRGKHRLRAVLVAAEIALAVVLLAGASLMGRGFNNLVNGSSLYEPSTLLTMRLAITESKYREPHQQAAFYRQVLERTAAVPGVRSSVAVTAIPYSQHSSGRGFTIEGRQVERGDQPSAMYQAVSPNYFETMHIPLRSGRFLTSGDGAGTTKVAVVSELVARRWWRNESPLGKRIKLGGPDSQGAWITIVGVAGDVNHSVFDRAPRRTFYVPFEQAPRTWMDIGIRAAGDPMPLAPALMAAIRSVDAEQPISQVATLETLRHNEGVGLTYVAVLMGVFGVLALVLSSVGVYGVMAYLVSEQTHEIGIRVALGAPRDRVLTMVFRRGMLTTFAGLAVGVPVAWAMARVLASLIFGVTAGDPVTFVGIPLALVAAAALAIYLPARRAMQIDPIIALREE